MLVTSPPVDFGTQTEPHFASWKRHDGAREDVHIGVLSSCGASNGNSCEGDVLFHILRAK